MAGESRDDEAAGGPELRRPGPHPIADPVNPAARPSVVGIDVDDETRCVHYHTALDVIAIKMRCCQTYYACKDCHDALAGHAIEVWPCREWDQTAVVCGACGSQMSIRRYLESGSVCQACGARFNPGCRNHYHYYFEAAPGPDG